MSKEATKKFVENKGFICNNCGKIIVDGRKHENEEDLCDQCKISDLETKLAEKGRRSRNAIDDLKNKLNKTREELEIANNQILFDNTEFEKLNKQLAESEKKNFELITKLNLKEHRPAFCTLADRECEALGKVEQLKQQLAELKQDYDNLFNGYVEAKKQLVEKEQEYKELKNKLHIAEQETLHFQNKYFAEKQIAIEELEKVKETAECVLDNALKNCSLNQSYYDRLLYEIDNQIKQLNEGE